MGFIVNIGPSQTNVKVIKLSKCIDFLDKVKLIPNRFPDSFEFTIRGDELKVRRTDCNKGWGCHHKCEIFENHVKMIDHLINKIVLLTESGSDRNKRHYRFSDVIRHLGPYWRESTKFILKNKRFEGSILREYIERTPGHNLESVNPNFISVLKDIIQKRIPSRIPANDELVIHLRLGDVNRLSKDYKGIIEKYISNQNIKKVTFCTAFHYGNDHDVNMHIYTHTHLVENINKVKKMLRTLMSLQSVVIDVKSTQDIDDDFLFMCKAPHFEADNKGRFTKLIQEVRE